MTPYASYLEVEVSFVKTYSSGAPSDGFLLNICSETSRLPRNFFGDV